MINENNFGLTATGNIDMKKDTTAAVQFENHYHVECYDKDGNLKWEEKIKNLIVNEGLDDILDKYLKGSSYTAAFYVGLTDDAPETSPGADAADTMASHAGWTEATGYSESVRQTLTLGTVSGQSVDNSASKASFSMNATDTIGGCFITTDSTKAGSSGTLYSVAAFTGGDRAVVNGDTLNVTATLTAASA